MSSSGAGKVDTRLKWPNDVWVGARKLSGCIVDHAEGSDCILVGLGINVNQARSARLPQQHVTRSRSSTPAAGQ